MACSISSLLAQQNPLELGKINWIRNFNQAKKISEEKGLPIFILFQEVPGCSTCRNFGNNVMGHFLIKEVIESYFVPLAIYNNKGGQDAEVLKIFNEAAWNNPVVHITDSKGKDLLSRFNGQYSPGQMITYIRKALQVNGKLIPEYVKLLEEEFNSENEELILEMYCFWSGEKNIGNQNGIVYTEAGFSNGKEVVKVVYDKTSTDAENIIKNAKISGNADAIHTSEADMISLAKKLNTTVKKPNGFRKDSEVHYYLHHSKYNKLELTPMQATKINSALGNCKNPEKYLSPRQLKLIEK